eukprot:3645170-Prorocentrum_lima.AAC.1
MAAPQQPRSDRVSLRHNGDGCSATDKERPCVAKTTVMAAPQRSRSNRVSLRHSSDGCSAAGKERPCLAMTQQ